MATQPPISFTLASAWGAVLAGSVLVGVLCGALVYHKAVRMRQGDQNVFFRAGWSVRQGGADLYEAPDKHGWHYPYPPLFAILMVLSPHRGPIVPRASNREPFL